MPDLITLSNEVLYEIIEKIGPYHIEAFASTCQILRTLSSPAMQRHRQLRRRYSKIEFGNHGKLRGDHPIFTLRDILKDPEIAHYSHTLGIGVYLGEDDLDFDDGRERLKVSREEIQAVAHDCVDLFTAALSQCPFVEKQEIQTWTAALLAGEDGAAVGILLTLLPNLKTIQMEGEIFGELEALIERVADDYNGSSVTQTQALKKLEKVQFLPFDGTPEYGDESFETLFYSIGPLFAIPSVRTVSASFLLSLRDDVFEWPYKARSSHVTELSLDHSTVSGASLPNLLSGIHSLRRFTYSAGGYWGQEQGQGHSHSYEPRLIIAALGLYAAHCLIYMHITGYRIGMGTEQDSQLDCDLKIFTQLKQLHTDYTLFNDVLRPCKSSCAQDSKACLCHPQRLVDRLSRL